MTAGGAEDLVAARRVLHAVAESLLAGPQHRATGTIRLAVAGDGFRTTRGLAGPVTGLRVGPDGVTAEPDGPVLPLAGSVSGLAHRLGIEAGPARDLYPDHAELGPDDELVADPAAVAAVLAALTAGAAALRRVFPDAEPVLWPEHFDVGVTVDEVNYGLSPGDAGHDAPYAYVGPWSPREGAFWNEPFGASRPAAADADGIAAFFAEGRRLTRMSE